MTSDDVEAMNTSNLNDVMMAVSCIECIIDLDELYLALWFSFRPESIANEKCCLVQKWSTYYFYQSLV